jgi:hypothetical protein
MDAYGNTDHFPYLMGSARGECISYWQLVHGTRSRIKRISGVADKNPQTE